MTYLLRRLFALKFDTPGISFFGSSGILLEKREKTDVKKEFRIVMNSLGHNITDGTWFEIFFMAVDH